MMCSKSLKAFAFLSLCVFVVSCAGGSGSIAPVPSAPTTATLQSAAVSGLSGTITVVMSSTEFSYETGFPHGHVPVTYAKSMVTPTNGVVKIGETASVTGTIDSDGHLMATKVVLGSASPAPSPSPTATATGHPSPSPSPSASPTSAPGAHVIVVIMENKGLHDIIGSSNVPYINNTLVRQGALLINSFDVGHPSEPNYEALYSGNTQGMLGSDNCPETFSGTSLGGIEPSFKWYAENIPSSGWTGCNATLYARRHVVMFNHTDTPASKGVPYTQLASDIASNSVPALAFVTPNLCDDMHDCNVSSGDSWLASHLPSIISYVKSHNGLLIVTRDEDDYGQGCVTTILVGAQDTAN